MVKARGRRLTHAAGEAARAGRPRQAERSSRPLTHAQVGRGECSGRVQWAGALAILGVALTIGLVSWRLLTSPGTDGTRDGPRPIATLDAPDVHSLLVDPANPDRVLFGSHAGVQESEDGGFTWRESSLQGADAMGMAASPGEAATFYVAGHDVFLVSRDAGRTWQPLTGNLPHLDLHAFAQDPVDPRRLYALVAGIGVFVSEDGGVSWAPLPAQPPGAAMHATLVSNGTSIYAVTDAGLARSRDRGQSWESLDAQPGGMVVALVIPAADPRTIYAGGEAGLVKSTDSGASWVSVETSVRPVLALAVAPSDPNRVLFVSEGGDVYRSDDGGASWLAPR